MIRRGLMFASCGYPQFHFSIVPGRKFSIRKSALATSSRRTCCPSGCLRSSVMLFLLRATTGHQRDFPWAFSRPHCRMGAPWVGGSTFTTSAPRSPSSWPQKGPARSVPSSITRRSERGPCLNSIPLAPIRRSDARGRGPRGPFAESRLLGRFETRLLFATLLELLYRVKAAIKELLSSPLRYHSLAERSGCGLVDLKVVLYHDPVPPSPFDRHEPRLDIELDLRSVTFERVSASAASPRIEVDEISCLDLHVIALGRQQNLRSFLTGERLPAARTRKSAVDAPGVSQPTII